MSMNPGAAMSPWALTDSAPVASIDAETSTILSPSTRISKGTGVGSFPVPSTIRAPEIRVFFLAMSVLSISGLVTLVV
jgi:hypothetical protein